MHSLTLTLGKTTQHTLLSLKFALFFRFSLLSLSLTSLLFSLTHS